MAGSLGGSGGQGGRGGAGGSGAMGGPEASVDARRPASDGPSSGCFELEDGADVITLSNCLVRITISKRTGLADYAWNNTVRIRGAFSAVRLPRELRVQDATTHSAALDQAVVLQDAIGRGKRITVTHASEGLPTVRQNYFLYEGVPFFLVDEEVVDAQPVSSNRMSVLTVEAGGAVDIGPAADPRILLIPFHNDAFTRYDARSINSMGTSHEVTAIYDNQSRNGLILGSATHDLWKTGITYAGSGGKLQTLEVYGGASSAATRDTLPHGMVTGTTIRSPRVFVGYFADWRDGLESFGRANGALAPNLHPWKGGVVFGFNTWAAYKGAINDSIFQSVSDFIAKSLTPNNFKGETPVFMNWDAGGTGSAASAMYVKGNGQRAGQYSTPFTHYGAPTDPQVLKDPMGKPLPMSGGGYALDPTHPQTKAGILGVLRSYKNRGYEYVKFDFMTNGINEGVFYDKSIATGVAAYNHALAYIAAEAGDSMFISLAISPTFPGGQLAHARRVSCDAFGGIGNSEYLMNNVAYGWWLSGSVYQYNDPDHIVLGVSVADGNKVTTLEEARTRVNASAIAGTVFIVSDKLDSDPEAQARAMLLLTNADINAIARRGKAFRPVEGNTGTKPPALFVSSDGPKGYLAIFNWSTSAAATWAVDLSRAGFDRSTPYAVRDLWSGARSVAKGTLSVTLPATGSTILELTAAP